MASFTDNRDRTWGVTINLTTLRRVRDELGVDLLAVFTGDLLDRVTADPLLLGELLWVLCRDQAQDREVSPEEFGELAGDGIEAATQGLLEALADFFPTRKRSALKLWTQKIRRLETLGIEAAERELQSERMEKILREVLRESSGSPTSSPPSSASTPDRLPSADS